MPPVAPHIDAKLAREAAREGFDRLEQARKNRKDHLAYYTGRWFGEEGADAVRTMNLMADAIHALLPNLVDDTCEYTVRPERLQLRGMAMKLGLLAKSKARELDEARSIIRPAVVESFFSPCAPIYTFLRAGGREADYDGRQMDMGEPASVPIPFDDWFVDPHAKSFATRGVEGHRFRASRQFLLQSPAYQQYRDIIEQLPRYEENKEENEETDGSGVGGMRRTTTDALTDRVALLNIVIYDGDRIYEGCIPDGDSGPCEWLRFEQLDCPRGGPYDHISYYDVPSNVSPLPPVASWRGITEAIDDLIDKLVGQAMRSKAIGVYKAGGKDTADEVRTADDGDWKQVDDPALAKVLELNHIISDCIPFLNVLLGLWDNKTLTNLLNGSSISTDKATGQAILNERAARRMGDMKAQVSRVRSSLARKWSWYAVTDPALNTSVPYEIPGVGIVELPLTAPATELNPDGFSFEIVENRGNQLDPAVRIKLILEALGKLWEAVPAAQAGLCDLGELARVMQTEIGITELDRIVMMPQLQMMQAAAEQGADAYLQQGDAARKGKGQPGSTATTPLGVRRSPQSPQPAGPSV